MSSCSKTRPIARALPVDRVLKQVLLKKIAFWFSGFIEEAAVNADGVCGASCITPEMRGNYTGHATRDTPSGLLV